MSIHLVASPGEDSHSLVANIISAYNQFDYTETDRLLEIALKEIERLSLQDQIEVYKYAGFRQFQKDDPLQAREHFWKLLEIDPTSTLDPVTTPPKIVALFQNTKAQYLDDLQNRVEQLDREFTRNPIPWRSLVFPGWEQWHRGYRWKGALWIAAGTGSFAGLIQAIIRTHRQKQDYEAADDPEVISARYEKYNRLYQSQFYWAYGFAAVWLSSHIDGLIFSPVKAGTQLSLSFSPDYPGIAVSFRF
ncbi:MAG: hypothetical protein GWO41_00030 [candidate division Zixibacteria bacterium]|nr:hypothetical protein [candidate division Zixibacteria bacterium]NIW47217.1 hypothetical protein [Gammaproteobacteria bacterium]NIX55747.1 hypothetical protein [candidate division Zixibacteria bacterium]